MIRETMPDVYDIKMPDMNLTVKEVFMLSGKKVMLLRAIDIKKRPHRGRVVEMTLYETFNFSRDEKGYWAGWIPNE